VNSSVRLIQTEDLGKTYSTPELAYQARFENERRWLTWDLLCGRISRGHFLWGYFRRNGIEEGELQWFQDNPCPPDVIGINHYLTSERYLDEDLGVYPRETHGGNRRHRYADVEAVRVEFSGDAGPAARIEECWRRYRLPIAITEAHLGCTSEEQLRWFRHVWNAAENEQRSGVDIRAVTSWAMLGSFDWNCLLTRQNGYYEPGAFDVRCGRPAPTPLAELLRKIAQGERPEQLLVQEPGWWQRPDRIYYPARKRETEVVCYRDLVENKTQASL
jgi:dTDP-4-dehydrorhamnose reductase